jgi:metal-dependent amidase/aminoacylase/carboxypeptidase family protein
VRSHSNVAEHVAQAHGATATAEFVQRVPSLRNTPEWVEAILPTARRVVGADRVVEAPASLAYDDVSVFVNAYGRAYLTLGCQDVDVQRGQLVARPGGRGLWMNHNPHFYVDESVLVTGVRLHANVALDYLAGALPAPTS